MGNNTESTLFLVLILVAVMIGAYYTTKILSKRASHIGKSKHIQIIDRMGLSKDKALFLTKVGKRFFFIGITNQTISTLGELEPGELENLEQEEAKTSEKGLFGKFSEILTNAKSAPENLRKARQEAKTQSSNKNDLDKTDTDDYIDQLSRKIEQRKSRVRSTPGGEGK